MFSRLNYNLALAVALRILFVACLFFLVESKHRRNGFGNRRNADVERRNYHREAQSRWGVQSTSSYRIPNRPYGKRRKFGSKTGSCRASTKCVPIPISKKQGYYYIPECVEMLQCGGGCGNGVDTCHATKVERNRVKVKVYKYDGTPDEPDFDRGNDYYVEMERHLECNCGKCQPQQCPTHKKWEGCRCVCTNSRSAAICIGVEKEWSEESCECRCKPKRCGSNQFLDPITCRCTNLSNALSGL